MLSYASESITSIVLTSAFPQDFLTIAWEVFNHSFMLAAA